MEKIVKENYGVQIVLKNDKLYIRFDEGGIAIKFADYEISEAESIEAMQSENAAYEVCLRVQRRITKK